MSTKSKVGPNKPSSDEDSKLVKKLMEDPVVSEHCQNLDKLGIDYQVIPIRRTSIK